MPSLIAYDQYGHAGFDQRYTSAWLAFGGGIVGIVDGLVMGSSMNTRPLDFGLPAHEILIWPC